MMFFLVILLWTTVAFSLAPSIGRRLSRAEAARGVVSAHRVTAANKTAPLAIASSDAHCANCPVCARARTARLTAVRPLGA